MPKNLEPLKVKELEIPVSSPQNYASDTIIIRLKPEAIPITKAQGKILASGLTAKYVLSSVKGEHPKFKLVKLTKGQDIQDRIKVLSADPNIEYAQPNYIYKPISLNCNNLDKGLGECIQGGHKKNCHDGRFGGS